MRLVMLGLSGAYAALNGVLMILDPGRWYAFVPGVTASGPFNEHFVTDAGLGFLVAGASLLAAVVDPLRALALAGAAFLVAHALYHLAGPMHPAPVGVAVSHLLGIHLPAVLATLGAYLSVRPAIPASHER